MRPLSHGPCAGERSGGWDPPVCVGRVLIPSRAGRRGGPRRQRAGEQASAALAGGVARGVARAPCGGADTAADEPHIPTLTCCPLEWVGSDATSVVVTGGSSAQIATFLYVMLVHMIRGIYSSLVST